MLKAGLTDLDRPIGVFLFAGSTGTGKTELAKALASFLFGSPDRMARLDMSEFQTADANSKIVGQRGETGSDSIVDRIRKQPFSVVLLDEFEKAHANTWDLFLQVFDDGRLTDANGIEADFRHCLIILTSNLGAATPAGAGLGFARGPDDDDVEQRVMRTVAQTFRPEFVNRIDKIIVFKPLSRELMRSLLHKELAGVQERRGLRDRAWAVEWEDSAIELLLDRGFSREMGARPLKRAIDQLLLAPLAATLVERRFPKGDQFLFVRAKGPALEVEFVDPDGPAAEPAELAAEPDAGRALSLPAIVLRQTGSAAERACLASSWREIRETLESDVWAAADERLRAAMADPGFWAASARSPPSRSRTGCARPRGRRTGCSSATRRPASAAERPAAARRGRPPRASWRRASRCSSTTSGRGSTTSPSARRWTPCCPSSRRWRRAATSRRPPPGADVCAACIKAGPCGGACRSARSGAAPRPRRSCASPGSAPSAPCAPRRACTCSRSSKGTRRRGGSWRGSPSPQALSRNPRRRLASAQPPSC